LNFAEPQRHSQEDKNYRYENVKSSGQRYFVIFLSPSRQTPTQNFNQTPKAYFEILSQSYSLYEFIAACCSPVIKLHTKVHNSQSVHFNIITARDTDVSVVYHHQIVENETGDTEDGICS
jgi:hypothetical protein